MIQSKKEKITKVFVMQERSIMSNHDEDDLLRVGPKKPLGYLPISTIQENGWTVPKMVKALKKKKLRTLVLEPYQCSVVSGAVFAYHKNSLIKMLDKHKKILMENAWPISAYGFVLYHILWRAAPGTDLFDLIADCYADKKNPLRKSNGFVRGNEDMPWDPCFSHFALCNYGLD